MGCVLSAFFLFLSTWSPAWSQVGEDAASCFEHGRFLLLFSKWHVSGVLCLLVGQTFLIVSLFVKVRRRAAAEKKLRQANEKLEQRVAERTFRMRESEQRLLLAIDAAYLISFEWDIRRNEVRRHVSADPALGQTQPGIASSFEAVLEIVHPDDRRKFSDNVSAAVEGEDGRYENEFRIVHPDGAVRWLYERGIVERDEEGQPVRLIGLSQDITERKQYEQAFIAWPEPLPAEKRP